MATSQSNLLLNANPMGNALKGKMSTNPLGLTLGPIGGINGGNISAPHPTVPTGSAVTSHTTTTSPDGTSTVKQTYAPQVKSSTSSASPASSASTSTASPIPTQASQQTPGQAITDTSGNTGTALYDPMTGKAYAGPQASGPNYSTTAQNTPGSTPYGSAVANVGNVANQGANNITNAASGNGLYGQASLGAINNLNGLAGNAEQIANTAGDKIAQIGQQTAGTAGGYLTGGLISPQALGGAAVQQQTGAAQQQAVAAGANTQLQGNQQAQNAYGTAGSQALTGQGQQITGATNAAGQAYSGASTQASDTAPQSYGLTSQPYNPTTDTYGGGGANGAIDRSIQAGNIGSASDLQTKINSTQAANNSAKANFDYLNSVASQGGIPNNVPLLTALQQKYSQVAGGAPVIAQFQAQLQSVRSAYTALTGIDGATAIPDTVTLDQLKGIQQSLQSSVQNNLSGYQNQLDSLKNGGGSSSSSGSYTSSSGHTYNLPY